MLIINMLQLHSWSSSCPFARLLLCIFQYFVSLIVHSPLTCRAGAWNLVVGRNFFSRGMEVWESRSSRAQLVDSFHRQSLIQHTSNWQTGTHENRLVMMAFTFFFPTSPFYIGLIGIELGKCSPCCHYPKLERSLLETFPTQINTKTQNSGDLKTNP